VRLREAHPPRSSSPGLTVSIEPKLPYLTYEFRAAALLAAFDDNHMFLCGLMTHFSHLARMTQYS
jgi:hypothetical protein